MERYCRRLEGIDLHFVSQTRRKEGSRDRDFDDDIDSGVVNWIDAKDPVKMMDVLQIEAASAIEVMMRETEVERRVGHEDLGFGSGFDFGRIGDLG